MSSRNEIATNARQASDTINDPGLRRAIEGTRDKLISAIERCDTTDVPTVVDGVQKLQTLLAVKRELVLAIDAGQRKEQREERGLRAAPPLQPGHIRGKR